VTTSTGAIDAVDRQGHAYALSTPRFEGAALLTR
jgi:hypothetical protein